ncbi:LysR family transcriptional regulator [Mycolicibacterium sp. F2034L]|uniref:LysR family transcriptional regulator n=1 Tax=Mycolicibacterium sp. F2034L TaxID=2926422 RepID=UPI001FF3C955|nr:LysR substrate-binding domain-containing protein [Mycolicibacterium sp. F2034L]MCK0174706.1 LysR substrate-binding domain-containing protein [Mycolicibacterium sp. F2034L]
MVEVREARYFIAVAEQLNFGRAAELLHMSQPPLSAAIKTLEGRLGVQLLHRTTREVRLTSAGAVFLDQCRILVAAAQTADSAARQAAEGQAGELRLGAVTSAFTDPLPAALGSYDRSHPGVDVHVREVDTHVGVEMVQRGELDIVLVRQMSTPRDCERRSLRRESFVLAAPADWELPDGVGSDLVLAAELPWVWIPRGRTPDYHDQVAASCRAAGFTPRAQHLAQSMESQLAMVAAGLGVALVPETSANAAASRSRIQTVRLRNSVTVELTAVWRAPGNRLVAGFLEELGPAGHYAEADRKRSR